MPSPNPKGRPRGQTLTAELRRQADPEAVAAKLLQLAFDDTVEGRVRLGALSLIWDRLEGKAIARSVRITASNILPAAWDGMSLDDRARALDSIRARALAGALPEGVDDAEAEE